MFVLFVSSVADEQDFFQPTNIIREIFLFKRPTLPSPLAGQSTPSVASSSSLESPAAKKQRRSSAASAGAESMAAFSNVMKDVMREMRRPSTPSSPVAAAADKPSLPRTGNEFIQQCMLTDEQRQELINSLPPSSITDNGPPILALASFEDQDFKWLNMTGLQTRIWKKLSETLWKSLK